MLTVCSGSGGDDYDEKDDFVDEKYWTDCDGKYSTLKQLEDRKKSIPSHCMEQYIADVQIAVLDGALKKYKDLVDKGYDEKFDIYQGYVIGQIPYQINAFMASDKVDKYFKCKDFKAVQCCKGCGYCPGDKDHQCDSSADCKSGKRWISMDKCPKMEFEISMIDSTYIPNATFSLTDEDGFFKDLGNTWGIDEDWVKFGKRHMRTNNGCQYAGENIRDCAEKQNNFFFDYPIPADKIKIYNPKDIIGKSYPKAKDMLERFRVMQIAASYDEQMVESDLVDATSLPAFSVEEAVKSMEEIVKKAKEIEKKEREEFILNFITGILFFIPFVGEAVGAGLTAVRAMARLIGATGEAALTIYEVVKDPDNAAMAVFSYLAGAGIGRSGFRNAANSRRAIPKSQIDGLGNVKTRLNEVESLRGVMCPI